MTMYQKFENLLKSTNTTAYRVHKETGIASATLSDWKLGKSEPKQDKIKKIADYFNVPVSYFYDNELKIVSTNIIPIDEDDDDELDLDIGYTPKRKKKPAPKKGKKIPVLGHVAAGIPIEAITDILDYEEITEELARTGEFFGLKIKGDSMEPRIKEGDVVIVRQQPEVESGQIAIVRVNGDDATCKKYMKHEAGVSLVSFNPSYPPMFYTADEVCEKPIVIIGRVVELRGKF